MPRTTGSWPGGVSTSGNSNKRLVRVPASCCETHRAFEQRTDHESAQLVFVTVRLSDCQSQTLVYTLLSSVRGSTLVVFYRSRSRHVNVCEYRPAD
eukprot:4136572-Pyramimonas_sp.AAC.1